MELTEAEDIKKRDKNTRKNSIKKNGNDDPVCKTGKKTQMCIPDFWTQRERVG